MGPCYDSNFFLPTCWSIFGTLSGWFLFVIIVVWLTYCWESFWMLLKSKPRLVIVWDIMLRKAPKNKFPIFRFMKYFWTFCWMLHKIFALSTGGGWGSIFYYGHFFSYWSKCRQSFCSRMLASSIVWLTGTCAKSISKIELVASIQGQKWILFEE